MNELRETIAKLHESNDADIAFIVAATINLYADSMRRRAGRILFGPSDVRILLEMIVKLITVADISQDYAKTPARSHSPNRTEEKLLIDPVKFEEALTEKK